MPDGDCFVSEQEQVSLLVGDDAVGADVGVGIMCLRFDAIKTNDILFRK